MTDAVLTAWISVGGVVLAALGIYISPLLKWTQSYKSRKSSAENDRTKADAAAYAGARDIWGDLIDDLRAQISDQREDIKTLRGRIENLEHSQVTDRTATLKIISYAGELRRLLRAAGIDHPDPPAGFTTETLT